MKSEICKFNNLVARNIKLYFKDKAIFFVSLISPLILIVLFLTFLGNVYETSLLQCLPENFEVSKSIVKAFTGGWLFSAIIATSCITVAFCSNLMVLDRVNKADKDFQICPVKKSTLQISYTISNYITTFIICFVAFAISLIYLAIVGWYLSFLDILAILADLALMVGLGTLLASIVGLFIKSQGVLSAVCTTVSSMYGFICGAYMPIGNLSIGIQRIVGFLPTTYGTVIFRNKYLHGVIEELSKTAPDENINILSRGFDSTFYFFDKQVPSWIMFLVVIGAVIVFLGLYILLSKIKIKRKIKQKMSIKTAK